MKTWHIQGGRYIVVGLLSNLVLYLLYLMLIAFGIDYRVAMTLLYLIGMLQTFLCNRSWTFTHHGAMNRSLRRYLVAYGVGYLLNLALLYTLVDVLRWPHSIGLVIVVVTFAPLLFLAQKYWVFGSNAGYCLRAG